MGSVRGRLGIIAVILCVCLGVFAVPRLLTQPEQRTIPALRIGLEDYYPPMAFADSQGRHTGFDQDMATTLCEQLGRQCEFVVASFDEVLGLMKRGELDVLIAGLAPLAERQQYMDFTEPYYRSRTIYIGRPEIEISPNGLRGKRLAAQTDTIQLQHLQANWSGIAEIRQGAFSEVLDMLTRNEVDLVLADALVCYEFLKSERGAAFDIIGDPLEINDTLSFARMGVRKDMPALVTALNDALMILRVNGEYDRITRKYFAFTIY